MTDGDKRVASMLLSKTEGTRVLAANASHGVQHLRQRVAELESRLAQQVRSVQQLEAALLNLAGVVQDLQKGGGE